MPLFPQFLASTCTPVPMCGKPKLKEEEKSCGDVGGRKLMPWLCCLRGGGMRVCQLDIAPWVPHNSCAGPLPWQTLVGKTAKPLPKRVYAVMAAVQLNIDEEPEMSSSFSSPALTQTLSPPYTRAQGTKISLEIPSTTLIPMCCHLLCARLWYMPSWRAMLFL